MDWKYGTKPKGISNQLCACSCGKYTNYSGRTGIPNKWIVYHFMNERTYEEVYGIERAMELKEINRQCMTTNRNNGTIPTWNKNTIGLQSAWNKNLTKETDERVAKYGASHKENWKNKPIEEKIIRAKRCSDGVKKYLENEDPEVLKNRNIKAQVNAAKAFTEKKHISSLDLALYEELDKQNIVYEKQKTIIFDNGHVTTLDAFIEPNISIYMNGDYWHSLPKVKDRDYLNHRDLKKMGYIVLVFKEGNFYKDTERYIEIIKRTMRGEIK